ncbi:zinc finger protein, putative [Babesia caballi]|uniref:Zinc finger protein, putative n=1 Tax=Babesia caballi TaxID=5871 RepID=A0AAV4LUX6_BABCB|nr:zinc finger protein, putative [Babesia caballi]
MMGISKFLDDDALSCFRTKLCHNYMRGHCRFTDAGCLYSHQSICMRRCPVYLSNTSFVRYIPVLCKYIIFGPNFEVIRANCRYGVDCIYAHCLDELLYHPNFYKTILCKDVLEGRCEQIFCPFAHSKAEQRRLKDYKVPFAKNRKIPPIKHFTLVDKVERGRRNTWPQPKDTQKLVETISASTCVTASTDMESPNNDEWNEENAHLIKSLGDLRLE